jgi:hypothetical protein
VGKRLVRILLLLLIFPAALNAQARLIPAELVIFRINRVTVENPSRTTYRRLTVTGRDDRGSEFHLYENSAPGARERFDCSVYLDDTIAELTVELVPELGRPESFSVRVPADSFRIGVFGAPSPLPPPYVRRGDPRQLVPGDLLVDPGTLTRQEILRLLEAGIHCLSSRTGLAVPEAGRYGGRLIAPASTDPGEITRTLAALRRELADTKTAYRELVTGNAFYGIPSRDPRPRFAALRPEDIAATLARDSFRWRLTRPQILALAAFHAACLPLLLLIRRPPLLLALLAALALGVILVLLQLPAREQLLVIELNPANLEAPELSFETREPGAAAEGAGSIYRARRFSEAAPLLAYRQLYSYRRRCSLDPMAGAALLTFNQLPLIRSLDEALYLEFPANPLKIWTVYAPQ